MTDRRRILLVTPAAPFPPTSGGAQRTALLFDALSAHGDVDTFILGSDAPGGSASMAGRYRLIGGFAERRWLHRAARRAIGTICPELRAVSVDRGKRDAVDRLLGRSAYDIVVLRYAATACQLRGLRGRYPGVTFLIDVDDLPSRLAAEPGRSWLGDRVTAACARSIGMRERDALSDADGLWVVGEPSGRSQGGPPVVRLPNIAFHRPEFASADDPSLDFIGVAQFAYGPNREGFDWFVTCVWPAIRACMPQARLRLIGRPPSGGMADRWRATPGVELAGIVDDLDAQYRAARVAVAPIRRGAGTKIKVIEALTYGVPCVCTSHAATDLERLASLVVVDDAASFARLCVDLATDDRRRAGVARAGAAEIAAHFTPADFAAGVATLLAATAGDRRQ